MARKEKNNVEYFPHSVNHGKKMFCLRSKYKNDGYAVWFMLIEQLGKADNHYLDLKDDVQMIYLSSELMVDEVVLLDIINMLVKLNVFDSELWNKERILYNEEFVESIADAYKKRNNKCIDRNSLILLLTSKGRYKPSKSIPKLGNSDLKYAETHKEKKRKENKRKEEEIDGFENIEYKFEIFWNLYDKKNGKKKCLDKFLRIKKDDIDKIIENVQKYVRSTPNTKYRKDPLTYLNGEHWNDEVEIKKPLFNVSNQISKSDQVIKLFNETDLSNTIRKYKSSEERVKERLDEFLEKEVFKADFKNRETTEVLSHFINSLQFNPPKKVIIIDENAVVPWLTK
tara:strand:- start:3051 stop:4073 length:1023 start_codon:yes stop_codon:yes gene_type:complete